MKKALFLDLDGTVRRTTIEGQPCPNKLGEQEILPNVKGVIQAHKADGYLIIGVTNQGGVGLGYLKPEMCKKISNETNELTGGLFDRIYEAMAKPQEKHYWTKPNPGMIEQAAEDFKIDLENSIMVGDKDTDMMAAKAARVGAFFYPKDFFGWD